MRREVSFVSDLFEGQYLVPNGMPYDEESIAQLDALAKELGRG